MGKHDRRETSGRPPDSRPVTIQVPLPVLGVVHGVREAFHGLRLPRSRGQVKAFGSRHGVYININSCGRCGSRAQRGIQRTCGRP